MAYSTSTAPDGIAHARAPLENGPQLLTRHISAHRVINAMCQIEFRLWLRYYMVAAHPCGVGMDSEGGSAPTGRLGVRAGR